MSAVVAWNSREKVLADRKILMDMHGWLDCNILDFDSRIDIVGGQRWQNIADLNQARSKLLVDSMGLHMGNFADKLEGCVVEADYMALAHSAAVEYMALAHSAAVE